MLYFYPSTFHREILYFLLHYIYLTTLVTLYIQINYRKYNYDVIFSFLEGNSQATQQ